MTTEKEELDKRNKDTFWAGFTIGGVAMAVYVCILLVIKSSLHR